MDGRPQVHACGAIRNFLHQHDRLRINVRNSWQSLLPAVCRSVDMVHAQFHQDAPQSSGVIACFDIPSCDKKRPASSISTEFACLCAPKSSGVEIFGVLFSKPMYRSGVAQRNHPVLRDCSTGFGPDPGECSLVTVCTSLSECGAIQSRPLGAVEQNRPAHRVCVSGW